ncbi:MAG: hypothetical protein RLP44_25105 [Aggregatilineales bacterium]
MRYIRAFWITLLMTLRGEKPQLRYARLREWINQSSTQLEHVMMIADQSGFGKRERKQLSLKLDGRDTTMQTVIDALKHHLGEEYPYLLNNITEHSVTAIYASNMNDQYFVMRLRDESAIQQNAPLHEAISKLSQQLNSIPPSTEI